MKKKTLVLILALVLVVAIGASGTLAYLTGKTDEVTNTFAIKGIFDDPTAALKLYEHTIETEGNGVYALTTTETTTGVAYDAIVPNVDLPKDPTLRIVKNSIDVYAFIQVGTWTANGLALTDGKLTATIDDDWTALAGVPGVYYQMIDADANVELNILDGETVTVPGTLATGDTFKDLTFKAFVIQQAGSNDTILSAADAWTAVSTAA